MVPHRRIEGAGAATRVAFSRAGSDRFFLALVRAGGSIPVGYQILIRGAQSGRDTQGRAGRRVEVPCLVGRSTRALSQLCNSSGQVIKLDPFVDLASIIDLPRTFYVDATKVSCMGRASFAFEKVCTEKWQTALDPGAQRTAAVSKQTGCARRNAPAPAVTKKIVDATGLGRPHKCLAVIPRATTL